MKRHAVYVQWLDHAKGDEPKHLKPVMRHTVGWVVKETDTHLVLAMDVSRDGQEFGFAIVKSLIRFRAPLAVPQTAH